MSATKTKRGDGRKAVRPGAKSRASSMLAAGRRQVAENPFAAIAGAAAISAGLALLLPASRREAEVMGEVADKLGEVAQAATDSAIEAGRSQAETLAQAALVSVGSAVIDKVVSGTETEPKKSAQAG